MFLWHEIHITYRYIYIFNIQIYYYDNYYITFIVAFVVVAA